MIHCSNPTCQAVSTLPASRCQACQTPLLYRFLLAVGDVEAGAATGTLVANRFWVWRPGIWLDTQPDSLLTPLEQVPTFLLPYLRLSDLAQHMSRPYFYLRPEATGLAKAVLLLDAAPIGTSVDANGQLDAFLLPSLPQAWAEGSALQQLNWLRQVAGMWSSLSQEQVAATLLHLEALRVDEGLLRLTTLRPDAESAGPVTLAALGQRWQPLAKTAQPEVKPYLTWLVAALGNGTLASHTTLLAELEQAILSLAQGLELTVDWVACTDQGPARDRNEDASHPQGQAYHRRLTTAHGETGPWPIVVVCDGIGGHEQGNVASQTAIKLLLEELQPLSQQSQLTPTVVGQRLKQAIILANDAISARNNNEHRSARARMGTTVVVALVHFPYISIAHLGDSRAYRISAQTCYQVTLDDDVASREAHLGYALYQEAIQIPSSGALIQALGISDSGYLYPNVQHLLLDHPSVMLLCSDGLSDYDRVELLWRHTVRPLVNTDSAVQPVAQELIQQANRLNGHDNVTVGLLRVTPQPSTWPTLPGHALASALPTAGEVAPTDALTAGATATPNPTRAVSAPAAPLPSGKDSQPVTSFPWGKLLAGIASLLTIGALGWIYIQQRPEAKTVQSLMTPLPMASMAGQPLPSTALAAAADISVGSFWQVGSATQRSSMAPLRLAQVTMGAGTATVPNAGGDLPIVPTGSILKVISRQTSTDQINWVRLQVCSIPSGESLSQIPTESDQAGALDPAPPSLGQRLSAPGDLGWTTASQLYSAAAGLDSATLDQAGRCLP